MYRGNLFIGQCAVRGLVEQRISQAPVSFGNLITVIHIKKPAICKHLSPGLEDDFLTFGRGPIKPTSRPVSSQYKGRASEDQRSLKR
jgi:hypothetical protein